MSVTGRAFLAFVVLSGLPFLQGWIDAVSLLLILLADAAVVYLFLRLYRTKTPEEGRTRIRQLCLTMTLVIVAFVVNAVV